jgi:hypothetical protein
MARDFRHRAVRALAAPLTLALLALPGSSTSR